MRVDLNYNIEKPDGEKITDRTAGQILSDRLLYDASEQETDIFKYYDWGMALGKHLPLELDSGDLRKLKDFVVKDKMLTIIVKRSILEKLKEQ